MFLFGVFAVSLELVILNITIKKTSSMARALSSECPELAEKGKCMTKGVEVVVSYVFCSLTYAFLIGLKLPPWECFRVKRPFLYFVFDMLQAPSSISLLFIFDKF